MERSRPVIQIRRALLPALALLLLAVPAAAHEQLVLIASADSPVQQLDSLEVRKLFLGLTVRHGNLRLRPLLNETDDRVKTVFLQNVVSMSDITYDRHLLGQALKQGRTQPSTYTDVRILLDAVAADPSAITYAWLKDVERLPRLKVLRVLWHD